MTMRRLTAGVAAVSLAALAFASTASPAGAWTKADCKPYIEKGEYPYDCVRFRPKTTTTTTEATTTSTTEASTTTTTVKETSAAPTPVEVQPKFTG